MLYCSSTDVASFSSTWTNNGAFDISTGPTLAEINAWIESGLGYVRSDPDQRLPTGLVTVPKALSVLKMQIVDMGGRTRNA
jgi:hypothetical protein